MNYQNAIFRSTVLVLFFYLISSKPGHAQHLFNFIQDGTNDVLATLELSSLPTTSIDQVVGLEFTVAGDAIFGFGVGQYPSSFDNASSAAIDLVGNILIDTDSNPGRGSFFDDDSPRGNLMDIAGYYIFSLTFAQDPNSFSFMALEDEGVTLPISARGRWHVVPEPTSLSLISVTALFCLKTRRRKYA